MLSTLSYKRIVGALLGITLVLAGAFVTPQNTSIVYADDDNALSGEGMNSPSTRESEGTSITCSFLNLNVPQCIFEGIYSLLLVPSALLLGVAGLFLDAMISIGILRFSEFVTNTANQANIALAWSLIRDVLNMGFIFVLLWIGIRTILGVDSGYQKLIPRIVIAGLLINFSFFFTEVMIDASNVITVELYESIAEIGEAASNQKIDINNPNPKLNQTIGPGISAAFMSGLNLGFKPDSGDLGQRITQVIFSTLTFVILAFLFLVMGAMILTRFIILIILLITSPIAFIGDILPQLGAQSKKWWSTLTDQLIFAPAFMLFMLITVLIVNSQGFKDGITADAANGSPFGTETLSALLSYAIVIGLMVAGLIIAKQLAGSAGKGFTEWASKKASAATFGAAAWGTRQVGGRLGEKLQQSKWVGQGLQSNNAFARYTAKLASVAGKGAATSSFDARGIGGLGKALGAEKGRTGGLIEDRKIRAKGKVERAETYATSIAIQNQREAIAAKAREIEETKDNLAMARGTGASQADIDALVTKRTKAEGDLVAAQNALKDLTGGFGANKAREELQKVTAALTAAQVQEAKASLVVVDLKEKQIEELKKAVDAAENPAKRAEAEARLSSATQQLATYRQDKSAEINRYIDAEKAVKKSQKIAKDSVDAAKYNYGSSIVGAGLLSTRQAADELRKQSKKPEDTIVDELKKMLASSETPAAAPAAGPTPPPGPVGATPPPTPPAPVTPTP